MLQPRTLITLAIIGLLLPVVLVALRQYLVRYQPDPMDCAEITQYLEAQDNVARLPKAPLLVLGDHTASQWPADITTLAEQPVLRRAMEGTTAATVASCFARLVAYYQPSTVLLFLDHRDQRRLETELTDEIQAINDQMQHFDVDMHLWVVGLIATPARDNNRIERLNRAVAQIATQLPDVDFIDINPTLRLPDGSPDHNRFWPNGDTLRQEQFPALIEQIGLRLGGETAASNGL
jgi:hypothetical protein